MKGKVLVYLQIFHAFCNKQRIKKKKRSAFFSNALSMRVGNKRLALCNVKVL